MLKNVKVHVTPCLFSTWLIPQPHLSQFGSLACLFVCLLCFVFWPRDHPILHFNISRKKKKNLLAHISSILLKCALQVSLCWSLGSLPTISRIQSPKIQDLTRVLPALLRVTSPLPVLGLETQEPWTPCQWPWPCCL